jgi:hypothetical protein
VFGRLRRRSSGSQAHTLAPLGAGHPELLSGLQPRQVGTTPEDRALLARLLVNPPAWDNAVPRVELMGTPEAAGPAPQPPSGAPLDAPVALPSVWGPEPSRGGKAWVPPALG